MKKSLLFAGAIFLTSGIAIAKTIDFDTQIKWNTKVIERALNKSGFLGTNSAENDVQLTHKRILTELLKRKSFSLREATAVCLGKCNMSDFLKNGRGESGKRCQALCNDFAVQLINENNYQINQGVWSSNLQDSSFSNTQGKPSEICKQLVSKAEKHGLTKPMLCGGKCNRFGDDKIIVTDNTRTISFTVDDFCDGEGFFEEKEHYMIVSKNGTQVVTGNTDRLLVELKKAQSQPAYDGIEKQKKSDYARLVQQNGNCKFSEFSDKDGLYISEQDRVDVVTESEKKYIGSLCQSKCEHYAMKNKCKIQSFEYSARAGIVNNVQRVIGFCGCNGNTRSRHKQVYSYTPTYQDCMKNYNSGTTCE